MTLEVLYGSTARGDSDCRSDLDILRVTSHGLDGDYTWSELSHMAAYGSLFLVHLRDEGQVVSGDSSEREKFDRLIGSMPTYTRVDSDLDAFTEVAHDVESALSEGDTPKQFEAQVVAKLVRHLAILACYLSGAPNFSRYGAVELASKSWGVPQPSSRGSVDYPHLYDALYDEAWEGESADVLAWVKFSLKLIERLREREDIGGVAGGQAH